MTDMLVPLYGREAPPTLPEGLAVRRPLPPEGHVVTAFVAEHFGDQWVSEAAVALAARPARMLVAILDGRLAGFACHDVTARGFFGPTGVDPALRGRGIGRHLLLRALDALAQDGYAYAIIGAVGPVEFYRSACGAIEIPGSDPGPYRGLLR